MASRPIRVLSERIMSRGFEPTVARLMENVQSVVRKQPGLLSLETLSDWRSQKDYDNWVNSEDFKKCTEKINEVLDVPGKRTTIFKRPNEDIFLL
ncbi:hypothetical protein P43SY_001396 [Pythium insidiosum]|uniref:ABM domain-containing protein n=1 Tax=Pythium insidiosum TaxID=114742 RepID=A0AAD5M6M9_PYTIN|nr:hypothetical protein P43SY_001396 [Pythium insidiosum]